MQTTYRSVCWLSTGLAGLIAVFVPSTPALAIPAPTGISVRFTSDAATITWREVPGSQGYAVVIKPLGARGPFPEEQVLANTYTVLFTKFPGHGGDRSGYTYRVCSVPLGGGRKCRSLGDRFYVTSQGDGVSTNNLHRAARKVSSCLGKGEEAGLVAAAGTGIVAAAVSWIPGGAETAAAAVGISAAGQGAGQFISCLASQ